MLDLKILIGVHCASRDATALGNKLDRILTSLHSIGRIGVCTTERCIAILTRFIRKKTLRISDYFRFLPLAGAVARARLACKPHAGAPGGRCRIGGAHAVGPVAPKVSRSIKDARTARERVNINDVGERVSRRGAHQ